MDSFRRSSQLCSQVLVLTFFSAWVRYVYFHRSTAKHVLIHSEESHSSHSHYDFCIYNNLFGGLKQLKQLQLFVAPEFSRVVLHAAVITAIMTCIQKSAGKS